MNWIYFVGVKLNNNVVQKKNGNIVLFMQQSTQNVSTLRCVCINITFERNERERPATEYSCKIQQIYYAHRSTFRFSSFIAMSSLHSSRNKIPFRTYWETWMKCRRHHQFQCKRMCTKRQALVTIIKCVNVVYFLDNSNFYLCTYFIFRL